MMFTAVYSSNPFDLRGRLSVYVENNVENPSQSQKGKDHELSIDVMLLPILSNLFVWYCCDFTRSDVETLVM